jgi:hypothetical protein
MLENEFGSSHDEDAVKQILEKGDVQEVKVWSRHSKRVFPLRVIVTDNINRVLAVKESAILRMDLV